ncbi:MAG: hypothetical protein WD401_06455 [Thermomicrobiaceae bacterium]
MPPSAAQRFSTPVPGDSNGEADVETGFTGLVSGAFTTETLPAAERIYYPDGGDLWQISETGAPELVTGTRTIASFSSSANGHRLAVLTVEPGEDSGQEQSRLSVVGSDGEVLFDPDDMEAGVRLEDSSPVESVSMSPSGDVLSVTHQSGAMTLLTLDGDSDQLMPPSLEHRPGRISWSADEQFIAFLDPWLPDEPSSLRVMVLGEDEVQTVVEPSPDGHGVVRAKWIPGTPYLVVIRESGSTISHGGNLFLIDIDTGRQELLMSSGEIAPVAGIVDVVPSPDGEWLAATGYVPGDEYPEFAGLWLINLESGLRISVALENDFSVTDMWWLDDQLLVRVIDDPRTSLPGTYTGREDFALLEIDPATGGSSERYSRIDDSQDDDENDGGDDDNGDDDEDD